MGLISEYYFKKGPQQPNMFVGGVAVQISGATEIAAELGVSPYKVKNVITYGDDLLFHIPSPFSQALGGWDDVYNQNNLTYFYDTGGTMTYMNQKCFQDSGVMERLWLPNCTHFGAPSGYYTLRGAGLVGFVEFPSITGQQGNMNHLFNSSTGITHIKYPAMTKYGIQWTNSSGRYAHSNMSGLERVYLPQIKEINTYDGKTYSNRLFYNVPANTVFYVDDFMETNRKAEIYVQFSSVTTGQTITLNGLTYTATNATTSTTFDVSSGNNVTSVRNLNIAINSDGRTGTLGDLTARHPWNANYIIIQQTLTGTTGNTTTFSVSNPLNMVTPTGSTFNYGGTKDRTIVYWEDVRGAEIRYVTGTTTPNPVIDLSGTNLTQTSFDVEFTPPSSPDRPLDFYEVWINDGVNTGATLWHNYVPYVEVSGSGATVYGVPSGITHTVKVVACDTLWNRSAFSNEIEITLLPLPNIFIGGVGSVITGATDIVSRTNLSEDEIINFQNDGTNISFYTEQTFNAVGGNNIFTTLVTYWLDPQSLCTYLGYRVFINNSQPTKITAEGHTTWPTQMFRYASDTEYIRFPNISVAPTGYEQYNNAGTTRLYLGQATMFGDPTVAVGSDPWRLWNKSTGVFYIDAYEQTSNSGGTNATIAAWIGGSDVRYVTNLTPPNPVTDLSVSDIDVTGCTLNFTPPSSTNALDFYEVWVDDGTNNPELLYHFFDEIPDSGSTLTGLTSGVTYTVKVVACDEFWNRSDFSNEVTVNLIPSYPDGLWFTVSATTSFTIPTHVSESYNYNVNWGDGNFETGKTGDATHTYDSAGTYQIRIGGTFPKFYFNNTGDKDLLLSVDQWGNIPYINGTGGASGGQTRAFNGCSNLVTIAEDCEWMNDVQSGYLMFGNCVSLSGLPDALTLENLDNGQYMFNNSTFTSLPSGMTLNNVTSATNMFQNGSLTSLPDSLTLSALTNGGYMFQNCSFTSLPSGMTLSNLATATAMFQNVPLTSLPSVISLSALTGGHTMFRGTSLTSLPDSINLDNLEQGTNMFYLANINSLPVDFDLPSLTNGSGMFGFCNLSSIPSGMTMDSLVVGTNMFLNNGSLSGSIPSGTTWPNLATPNIMFNGTNISGVPSTVTLSAMTNGYLMFNGCTINTTDYSQLINNIDTYNPYTGITFHGGSSTYNSSAQTAHDNLTGTKGWSITDGGLV